MGRPPCCDKSNVKRGLWTPEEDAKILAYVSNHGTGNWTLVPKIAGLNRCGKSCRLRWTNYLRPDLKHDSFTPHEEELIINLHKVVGSRWSLIAKQLPGRTDNDVKNYWNTKLKKKLHKMGIDPVTHKSYSQILSDYGNISSLIFSSGNPFSNMMGFSAAEPSSVITGPSTSNKILSLEQPQFQFTNHDIVQPHFFNDVSSSCSSSSSTTFTQLNSPKSYSCQQSQPPITPSSPRLWSEFLVNDPALSADYQQDHESTGMVSSLTLAQKEISHDKFANEGFGSDAYRGTFNGNADISSWSATSFVDGILDKDTEMRSQFPQLLDSSFDY